MKVNIKGLPWKALMRMAELKTTYENGKHKNAQPWHDHVTYDMCIDSLTRHVAELCTGVSNDEESGFELESHIALRALMLLELRLTKDEGDDGSNKLEGYCAMVDCNECYNNNKGK